MTELLMTDRLDYADNNAAPSDAPGDLSQAVVYLARHIDRLPPGDYMIMLRKPEGRTNWQAEIRLGTTVRVLDLWR